MKFKSLLLAASLCASASAYALEGHIMDSDGKAINGALVELIGKRQY